jgi:hypothetical protein
MSMRHGFFLVPAALLAVTTVRADDYLTVQQAQQLIFPGAAFTPHDLTLTDSQVDELERWSHATVFRSVVKVWKVSSGGWFFLDQVPGRDDRITYAVGLDPEGTVVSIEILTCVDAYNGITRPLWRDQFVGRKARVNDELNRQILKIDVLSGTTLSSAHVTEGVRRVLATYALFLAPGKD